MMNLEGLKKLVGGQGHGTLSWQVFSIALVLLRNGVWEHSRSLTGAKKAIHYPQTNID
jgi:hypothetical protein